MKKTTFLLFCILCFGLGRGQLYAQTSITDITDITLSIKMMAI